MSFLIASVASFIVQNMANKEFSRRFNCRMPGMALFYALALTMCSGALAIAGGKWVISGGALLLATTYAIDFVVTINLIVVAMSMGPMSASVLIINMSMILPVAASLLIWGESLTLLKVFGIACMLMVLVLSAMGGKGDSKKGSAKWLMVTIITMVGNGMLSIQQKSLSLYYPEIGVLDFSFVSFAIAAAVCWLAVAFFALRKADFSSWLSKKGQLTACAAGVGLGTAGGNAFQLISLTMMPAVVNFPLIQGSVVLSLWVLSIIIYRDKLTLPGIISLICGIAGIVMLSIG